MTERSIPWYKTYCRQKHTHLGTIGDGILITDYDEGHIAIACLKNKKAALAEFITAELSKYSGED